jgi:hypothetical protein
VREVKWEKNANLWIFFFRVHNNQGAVLFGVNARERRAQNFEEVPLLAEVGVKGAEVRVGVVAVPIKELILNVQRVSWEVPRRVAQVVELIPQ